MVATRLISMHSNKGKSIQQCLKDRMDYAQNPEKQMVEFWSAAMSVIQSL